MTSQPVKLVVISAGLSQPSTTRLLADRLSAAVSGALAGVPAGGAAPPGAAAVDTATVGRPAVEVASFDLRDTAHDVVNHLLTGFPSAALRPVLDAVAGADGLIAVTPIFSASYSGLFKSFFDVLDREALAGKPVLIAATGGTARHSLALEHELRPLFTYLRALVVPTSVFAAAEDFGATGLRERIDRAAGELAEQLRHRLPSTVDDPFALTTTFDELLAP